MRTVCKSFYASCTDQHPVQYGGAGFTEGGGGMGQVAAGPGAFPRARHLCRTLTPDTDSDPESYRHPDSGSGSILGVQILAL